MDAHYTVHSTGAGVQLFFKAAGGPDNRQFLDGLEQLLRGLGRRHILLGRVAIDTSQTRGKWSLEERTLTFSYPVDLEAERDYRDLRMRITGSARRHLTVPSSPTSRLLLELFATDPNIDVAAEAVSLGTDSDFGPTADESVLRERAERYRRRAGSVLGAKRGGEMSEHIARHRCWPATGPWQHPRPSRLGRLRHVLPRQLND
jgi:hypothetical protein